VVNAYRERGAKRLGRPRLRLHPFSILGLVAVLLVLSVGHVAAARLNLIAYGVVTGISGPARTLAPLPTPSPSATAPETSETVRPTATASPTEAPLPTGTPSQWDPQQRLNILLIGTDARPDIEGHYNTDTLIVASVDPQSGQVAMMSLPRDTIRVPLPDAWPASDYYGGAFPEKINRLYLTAEAAPRLFPGPDGQRGFEALKGAIGTLYGINIPYYIEVDFQGFREIVDTLGGVVVDVQVPVSDDAYPIDDSRKVNLYIPAGIQLMNGEEALSYARARHRTNDFDRALRQQRIIVSLRRQTDLPSLLAPGRLEALAAAVQQAVHTDIPPDLFPQLVTLADRVDLANMRSLVFTPPVYQVECTACYSLTPKVDAIRQAVRDAFAFDPELEGRREAIAQEAARVWVLNGSGRAGHATAVVEYLDYWGIEATIPGPRADRTLTQTEIVVYNGAEERLTATIALLEETFGVEVTPENDPQATVDIFITTGTATPDVSPPP
jgi:LCP family protein required for cell wall assembly